MDNNNFLKDKRKRIAHTEKTERRPADSDKREGSHPARTGEKREFVKRDGAPHRREETPRKPFSGSRDRYSPGFDRDARRDPDQKRGENSPRRSYNPNFTPDNQLRDGGERRDGFRRDDRPRRDFDANRSGERREGFGERRENFGDRKPYGKPREFGHDNDKPRYPKRDDGNFNREDKPRGFGPKREGSAYPPRRDDMREDKPRYPKRDDDRKTYGKPTGDRPFRKFDDRPGREGDRFGAPKSRDFGPKRDGDRPFRKPEGDRPGRDGDRKFGPKPDRKPSRPAVNGIRPDGSYPTFAAPPVTGEMRLNRHIANSGRCSRRDADELIRTGRVTVNGAVVVEMGAKVQPGDTVEIDGQVASSEKKVYIVMNKPKGFVTTLEDPHAEKTVIDLLGAIVRERVYPVGRLDKNSLGVLLITNDGDLTTQLTHPSYNKKKIYQATLDRALTHADMEQIAEGVTLDDGEIRADAIEYASENRKEIGLEIHSGRNRVVRRIFEHLGYKVVKLDRVYFAGITKKNLKRGQWRFLTPTEVDILRSGMYE